MHSYPGNAKSWWNKSKLETFLLNSSWLRHETLATVAPCLAAWNRGPRQAGLEMAVTETAAMCGVRDWPADAPTPHSFIHCFFTVANLGQFALNGVSAPPPTDAATRLTVAPPRSA